MVLVADLTMLTLVQSIALNPVLQNPPAASRVEVERLPRGSDRIQILTSSAVIQLMRSAVKHATDRGAGRIEEEIGRDIATADFNPRQCT